MVGVPCLVSQDFSGDAWWQDMYDWWSARTMPWQRSIVVSIIIIIIITTITVLTLIQIITLQYMSIKIKLLNRSCGLATAVCDRRIDCRDEYPTIKQRLQAV